uniref:Uncharacterized protein n=1 Tax=Arundo donax TaxID=35708 RepID=A0A0A9E783_ARUDO
MFMAAALGSRRGFVAEPGVRPELARARGRRRRC